MLHAKSLRTAGVYMAILLWVSCLPALAEPASAQGKLNPSPDKAAIRASIDALGLDLDNLPRLDCSTSAQPLLKTVLGVLFDEPTSWRVHHDSSWRLRLLADDELPQARMGTVLPEGELDSATLERRGRIEAALAVSGTHDAYANVIRGERDLAVIARKLSDDEKKLMREANVQLDIQPVALDAFVMIVHPDAPLDGLTLEQVRGVFTGRITNWQELGGPDHAINPYTRERNSGSQELMISHVMGERPFAEHARDDSVVLAMTGPMRMMARDPFGISYSVHYYTRYMAPDVSAHLIAPTDMAPAPAHRTGDIGNSVGHTPRRTRMLAIDGIHPDAGTIADGSYPLIEPVYLVTRRDLDETSPAARLRDWLMSEQGQEVIRQSLYVNRHGVGP